MTFVLHTSLKNDVAVKCIDMEYLTNSIGGILRHNLSTHDQLNLTQTQFKSKPHPLFVLQINFFFLFYSRLTSMRRFPNATKYTNSCPEEGGLLLFTFVELLIFWFFASGFYSLKSNRRACVCACKE